ncbi:hypothetical protein TrVE_jg1181 [Triparma verrucosa]|uniref:YdbS-like PH domain-containing protein n=2 Tax=Triparma TaxID=722752 RepID=A0A9W7E1M6_9STRA|nr:hypothetical protein TrST_g9895 [Triparma strigata]GMH98133.1 hypothetical protein TrVE_jg1181 [Triparma verrucosa]
MLSSIVILAFILSLASGFTFLPLSSRAVNRIPSLSKDRLCESTSSIISSRNTPFGVNPLNAEPTLEEIEALSFKGKGSGKRGGDKSVEAKAVQSTAALTPEVDFYEGPPAITECIIPTISILTVIGIIPAIASYSRQAWVRYKITSRRIRVTSGFGGKDMAEIVYPDIVEVRSVPRLLGDGDFVFFLKDGAKFEMRNVPKYEDTKEYILGLVGEDVKEKYMKEGQISR